ncbi:CBF-domain-containing protein [Auriculariales sp. MPI-PUGE-AT-0066]|nr:CBF-domain-containing protein [Auriculariales sp. MPI-PUGE-AT-0066]
MPRNLKSDVHALGGDDEDVALLQAVDSDSELRPAASSSKDERAIAKDLSKFMKGLDFGSGGKATDKADTKDKKSYKKEKTDKESRLRAEKPPAEAPKSQPKQKAEKPVKKQPESTPAAPRSTAKQVKQTKIKFDDSGAPKTTTVANAVPDLKTAPSSSRSNFLLQPASNWYEIVPDLSQPAKPLPTPSAEIVSSRSARATDLLAQDVARYEAQSSTSSGADAQFLSRVLSGGTLSDRLSALTLLAQGSPVHNASALEQLRGLAKKKSREQSLKAVRAIVDWWVGGGAPERKLRYFRDQPLTHPEATDAHITVWHFEDWLKKYFYSILQILEALTMDPLPYVRIQAITFVFQLLRDRPEQEQNLLRLLVNKLGDSDRPVASRVSYHLMQLVQSHPQMKGIIISEVSASIFGGSDAKGKGNARYYAVITFNQMVLSAKETAVADRLMDLYFKLFREMLGEGAVKEKEQENAEPDNTAHDEDEKPKRRRRKGGNKAKGGNSDEFTTLEESDSKMISAILTGINRALPFASLSDSTFNEHINTLFRITHEATFNISVQALMLIDHVVSSKAIPTGADLSNRFYRTLYAALLDPRLPASGSKHALFLTLLFRAIKRDGEVARACAFVKRVLQAIAGPVCAPGFACAALVMLGKLCQQRAEIRKLISDPPSIVEGEAKYEPTKREPLYAHAEASCLWELVPLLHHFHPSVALHAQQLRDGERLTGAPDVGLYSLAAFLDRFVLKNAKKKAGTRGASAMQPSANDDPSENDKARKAMMELDDESLGKMNEANITPEQVFYHRFVKLKGERERKIAATKKGRKKTTGSDDEGHAGGESDDDGDGEGSGLDEDEVWAAMKANAPGDVVDAGNVDIDDDSVVEMPMSDDDDDDESAGSDDSGTQELQEEDGGQSEDEAEHEASAGDSDSKDGEDELDLMEDGEDVMDDDDLVDLADFMGEDGGQDEEWGGIGSADSNSKKRKRSSADEPSKRKKRLRDLPTFATYEDYQRMIEEAPEDNI